MSTKELYDIVKNGLIEELKQLLETGIDVNQKNKFGFTALHYAISRKHQDMSLFLLEQGADPSIQDNDGNTALHYAAAYDFYLVAELILKLKPEIINIQEKHGNGALWTTVMNPKVNYEMASLLLKYGADYNQKNKVNLNPWDVAHQDEDEDLLKMFASEN